MSSKGCFTIDSKDILDFLLNDPDCHFDAVCVCHGMDLIGIQAVQVKNLGVQRDKVNFFFNSCFGIPLMFKERSWNTHVTILDDLLQVDAFCVKQQSFLAMLTGDLAEQAARNTFDLMNNSILGLRCHQRSQVKAYIAER